MSCSFVKFSSSIGIFLNAVNLICRSTDISKCFRGSLRLRDNESQLYMNLQTVYIQLRWPSGVLIVNMNGWITCDFMSVSTAFQSYQDDERLIMKGCLQWNPING